MVQVDVRGAPGRSRGVPGLISGLKPRRNGPKILILTPFLPSFFGRAPLDLQSFPGRSAARTALHRAEACGTRAHSEMARASWSPGLIFGAFKRTPGSFKRTPGPFKRTPGASPWGVPGPQTSNSRRTFFVQVPRTLKRALKMAFKGL